MIYVTGCSGYLGSNIVKYLEGLGHHVIILSRTQPFQHTLPAQSTNIRFLDYRRLHELDPINQDSSILIHAASPTSSQLEQNPNLISEVLNQERLLYEYALTKNIGHIIYLSSVQIYGRSLYGDVTTSTEPQPYTSYSNYKLQSELQLSRILRQSPATKSILRLSNIFGRPCLFNHHSWDLFIHDIIRQSILDSSITIKSSRQVSKDFVPISHFLSCISALMGSPLHSKSLQTYNISTGSSITLHQAAQVVVQMFKKLLNQDIVLHANNNSPHQDYRIQPSSLSEIPNQQMYELLFTNEIQALVMDAQAVFQS